MENQRLSRAMRLKMLTSVWCLPPGAFEEAVDDILAIARGELVCVVAVAAEQIVVAEIPAQRVVAGATVDLVGIGRAEHDLIAPA